MSANILYDIHNCSAIVSTICILLTLSVCLLPHSLNPSSSINPCKSRPQGAVSANAIPPALPCPNKAQETAAYTGGVCRESERVAEGEGKRSGIERGSRRWRAGERGFFGKGANPITGSGAALVSLAALNSHFNGPFLPLPVPFSFYLCLFLLLFHLFFLIMAHTRTHPQAVHLHTPHASLSPFVCLSWLHERGKGIELYHWRSILSPYSCVMLGSEGSSQHPGLRVSHNSAGAYQPSAEEVQQGLIRSPYPSVLPVTPEGANG